MEWKFKKNEKTNKVILLVLCGLLLLVLTLPSVSGQTEQTGTDTETADTASYETRLRELLADAYGEGMVDVMVYAQEETQTYYGASQNAEITGVLVTVSREVVQETTTADITMAVCALFNLPAHKVAVLVK